MRVIIYDFEVFKHDWLVVFKEVGSKEVVVIENDPASLREYYEEHRHNIFAGFNVKYYDTHVFKAIMSGLDAYEVSRQLIEERIPGYRIPGIKRYPLMTYDLSQDIQGAPFLSLKEAEGNMGLSIVESTVDFKIDRPLTEEELIETEEYCLADVLATERLFETRFEDFKASVLLIKTFDLGIENVDKTTAQLLAMILGAKKGRSRYDELIYDMPDTVQVSDQRILELYNSGPLDYKKTITVDIAGVPHKMAYGGIHGALKQYGYRGKLVFLDVTSYYPAMMIEYNFMSRNARYPERFTNIFNERVEYKKIGHEMAYPYKIAIAATFGCMKNKYNNMYDPKQPNQICITGQLLLVDLIEKIEPHIVKLIQSNTDGIGIIIKEGHLEQVEEIVTEWQDRTGMNMEWDWSDGIWQKDVNNYILLSSDGKIKTKGGYVSNHKGGDYRKNSLTIVDKAVVQYIVYGIDPKETIYNEKQLIRFQQIAKAGATFTHNVYDIDGELVPANKVNRVFASTDDRKGKVYKVKGGKPHATPGLPDRCLIYNDSIEKLTTDDIPELDKDWYVDLTWQRIKDFGVEGI